MSFDSTLQVFHSHPYTSILAELKSSYQHLGVMLYLWGPWKLLDDILKIEAYNIVFGLDLVSFINRKQCMDYIYSLIYL